MGLGLFLFSVLAGYWFLTNCYWTQYGIARTSSYHVFFQAAIAGGFLVIAAEFILNPLSFYRPPFFCNPILTVSLSVLLGLISPFIVNLYYDQESAAQRAAINSGDFIELLLAESIENGTTIEVSLKNRKSYIGIALNSGLEIQGDSDVALMPFISGYREPETNALRLTTFYAPVLNQLTEDLINSEQSSWEEAGEEVARLFRIVVPMSEIVSVRFFDPEIYDRFQEDSVLSQFEI